MEDPDGGTEPRAPAVPVGLFVGVGFAAALLGLLGMLGLVMGVGLGWFLCPASGLLALLGLQFIFARATGLPVQGPAEPMGAPPDEE